MMNRTAERQTAKLAGAVIAVIALAFTFASSALARPGELDRSFGRNARVALALPRESPAPSPKQKMDIASAPKGRVVAASGGQVVELLSNGKLRRNFGRNGRVGVSAPAGWRFLLAGVAVDSRGRVLVAGTTESLTETPGPGGFPGPPEALATMYRYLPTGKPDPSFGEGGQVLSSLGQAPPDGPGPAGPYPYTKVPNEFPYATPSVKVTGMSVDAQDRPVLLGTSVSRVTACGKISHSTAYLNRSYVARLGDGGELDTTFGSGGVVTEPAAEEARTLALGPGGEIAYTQTLGEGCPEIQPPNEVQLIGLQGDGAIGQRIFLEHPPSQTLELQAASFDRRGRVLLLIERSGLESSGLPASTTVLRLLPNGSQDLSFGRHGVASPHPAQQTELQDLAIDSRGRLLLAGTARAKGGASRAFMLTRLSAAGKQEASFGRDGRATTRFPGNVNASSVSLDESGRILVGGTISGSTLSTGFGLALARYLAN